MAKCHRPERPEASRALRDTRTAHRLTDTLTGIKRASCTASLPARPPASARAPAETGVCARGRCADSRSSACVAGSCTTFGLSTLAHSIHNARSRLSPHGPVRRPDRQRLLGAVRFPPDRAPATGRSRLASGLRAADGPRWRCAATAWSTGSSRTARCPPTRYAPNKALCTRITWPSPGYDWI